MRSLDTAREACERHHPGLGKALAEIPLPDREAPGSPVIDLFRSHDGPGLLAPAEYGGHGADALEAVRIMRAIGSYSPSLAAAATMHHFTVAMLFELARGVGRLTRRQIEMLSEIGPGGLLIASGWAEGRTEQNILNPSVVATRAADGYLINGAKKPCSLSRSMDLLTASVALPADAADAADPASAAEGSEGEPTLAVLLLPADSPGISVRPFWESPVLAAAQSHEVRLSDVHVTDDLVIRTTPEDPGRLDDLQTAGFVWFETLISAAYVGAASALVERVLERGRGSVTDRGTLCLRVESAMGLVEGMARSLSEGVAGDAADAAVAAVLVTRFAVQDALTQTADLAVELLGGMAFIGSPEIAYLAAAVRPLAFHPPSRTSAIEPLVDYFCGRPLVLS
jgi:alkylation response protein AidB-like acyl-CoA dehydrogenase